MKTLCLALLISMYAATGAAAQSAPAGATDFSGITTKRTAVVIDDRGNEARGRILRLTPDQLTLLVYGREVSVERRDVAAVYERGDSVKNGMLLGLMGGATLGAVALSTSTPGDDYAQAGAGLMVLIGLGVGTAVDAFIPGKRLLYRRAGGSDDRDSVAISITPSIARARMSLSTSVVW